MSLRKRFSSDSWSTPCAERRATMTRSSPAGILCWLRRKISRKWRFTRLRATAFPTARETTTPMRAGSASPRVRTVSRNQLPSSLWPVSRAARKSAPRRTRCAGVSRKRTCPVSDNGEALAALLATEGEDLAAPAGGLSGAKPDLTGALLLVRAIGRLHGEVKKRRSMASAIRLCQALRPGAPGGSLLEQNTPRNHLDLNCIQTGATGSLG